MHNLNETIASVWIEHNQNKIARRDCARHTDQFLDHCCLFEKLAVVGRLFWQFYHFA